MPETAEEKRKNKELKDKYELFKLKSEYEDNPDTFLMKMHEDKKELERAKAELAEQKKLAPDSTKQSSEQKKALSPEVSAALLLAKTKQQAKQLQELSAQNQKQEQRIKDLEKQQKDLTEQNKKLSDALKSKSDTPPKPVQAPPQPSTSTAPSLAPQPSVATSPSLFSASATASTSASDKFSCPGLIGIKMLVYGLGTTSRTASVSRLELVFSNEESACELQDFFKRQKPYPPVYSASEIHEIMPRERLECFKHMDNIYSIFDFTGKVKSEAFQAGDNSRYKGYILLRELEKYVDVTSVQKVYWDPVNKRQIYESDLSPELKPSFIDEKVKAGLQYSKW